jgi:glycosyltransferase involved in cell wall biosynthesis
MKILVIASDKQGRFAPFIEEQITALQACGMSVIRYSVTGKGITGYLRELPALRRLIRAERPDIIHAHFGLCGLLATLATIGLHTPVVVTYHVCDINAKKNRPFSKVAMYLSAWNIFVSHRQMLNAFSTEQQASKHSNWSIIPCGIDTRLFDSENCCEQWFNNQFTRSNYVLFAGSFDNFVKGPELAKQAVEIYNASHSKLPIELLELRGYTREQVVTLMHKCSALLLTSIREGSPQVVKEAMACGCPIVSVDVGDVAERLNGVKGSYVVPNRDAQSLAAALEHAVAFGRTNGREKLLDDRLDNTQVAETLISIYTKIKNK